jgi:endonuclease V-like protein UPF0215 family
MARAAIEREGRAAVKRIHRPHLLGIDDGPVTIRSDAEAVVVGVVMEGHDLVEAVAVTRFPVDGPDATGFLAGWVRDLRARPGLQGIVLGGITIAGLGIVDITALAARLRLPVVAVSRRDPRDHRLAHALAAAGLGDRLALVERTPPASALAGGLYASCAGLGAAAAAALVRASRAKADLPEPLRLAHLIARAVTHGESRGRA